MNVAKREGAVANPLFECLLRLGDDRLVLGHRAEASGAGHGPILEEDIAIANIALDLVGQGSSLLKLAGETEGAGRDEDALAYFRSEPEFRNAQIVELPKGDFAFTIARQFLFDAYSRRCGEDALQHSTFAPLAGIAAKALKEDRYHLRHSGDWVLRLGDGTDESHARAQAALDRTLAFHRRAVFETDAVDEAVRMNAVSPWIRRSCSRAGSRPLKNRSGARRSRFRRRDRRRAAGGAAVTPSSSATCSPRCRSSRGLSRRPSER